MAQARQHRHGDGVAVTGSNGGATQVDSTPKTGWRGRVEGLQAWVERTRRRWRLFDLGVTVVTRPDYVNDTLLSSYFAMRLFVLLFPLAYTAVAGIGLYADSSSATPDDTASNVGLTGTLAESIADAARGSQRSHILILLAGLVLSVWAGRGALRALRILHAAVWRVPAPKTALTDLGGIAFAAAVVVVAWLGTLTSRLRGDGVPIVLTSGALGLAVASLWLLVSWRLPHGAHRRWDLLPGAVLLGVGAPAINIAVQVYFAPRLSRATATYGVLGGSLVLLTYLLVVAWTIVLGTELDAAVLEWRTRERGPA
jgi:uncharacterized BrkB/YihY/UPF0761 family membrane protein